MSQARDGLLAAFEETVGAPDPSSRERMRTRLSASLDPHHRRRLRTLRGLAATATVAAAVAAGALLWSRAGLDSPAAPALTRASTQPRDPTPVTHADASPVMASGPTPQSVALPHEGRLELDAHTRIRLETSAESGARVELLAGAVTLDVHRVDAARWRVIVDQHEVEAIGTRFRVQHRDGPPDVIVERGVVALRGPGLPPEGVRIHAEPAPMSHPVEVEAPSGSSGRDKGPNLRERFRAAIRRGDDAAALAMLPDRFPAGMPGFTPADFVDAGDALAAAGGSVGVARADAAYRAACEHASRSPACGVATLRRALRSADAGELARAIELATEYLERHPDGPLARDALGRRMEWAVRAGHGEQARRDAQEYTSRWPDGPRAALAASLAGG